MSPDVTDLLGKRAKEEFGDHHPYGPSRAYHVNCPASIMEEAKAEKLGVALEEFEDAAGRGTERHKWGALLNGPIEDVPEEHRWAVGRARDYILSIKGVDVWEKEVFLEVRNHRNELITFGTADYVSGPRLEPVYAHPIVVDFKHGEAIPERGNLLWQMHGYAVGAAQKFRRKKIEVRVFHVISGIEWVEVYDDTDQLLRDIEGRIRYAQINPEQHEPKPSNCRFCRGKSVCEPFKLTAEATLALMPAKQKLDLLTTEGRRRIDAFARLVSPWIAAWEKYRKALPDDKLAELGYERAEREVRAIKDMDAAFTLLWGIGIKRDEFLALCGLGIGDLEKLLKDKGKTGAEAAAIVSQIAVKVKQKYVRQKGG